MSIPLSAANGRSRPTASLTISERLTSDMSAAMPSCSNLERDNIPWASALSRSDSAFTIVSSRGLMASGTSSDISRSTEPMIPVNGVFISCDTSAMKSRLNASTLFISSTSLRWESRSRASSRIRLRCRTVKSSTSITPEPPTIAASKNPYRARLYGAITRSIGMPSLTLNSPLWRVAYIDSAWSDGLPTESNTTPPGPLNMVSRTPSAEHDAPNSCICLKSPVLKGSKSVAAASSVLDARSRDAHSATALRNESVSETKTVAATTRAIATSSEGSRSAFGSFTA